ncbi:hypothetical protein [Leucothrix pacifica]|uniref:DUF4407 domain-containing protein n=1 Tax=Leucothrix pacifica TaxID=1247513 RepID=A0A317CL43_9GAMM|nr:hypothetical protein [Leucothrix pacifica]PWQ98143.1 hypothetical protein DKW60_08495 [Leucothrix pacifica]
MISIHFFRLSWIVQLLVGICLFTVSFLIEKQVLEAFIATPMLALLLAGSLELGKAVAIIWHRYMSHQPMTHYPGSVRLTSNVFRMGLVLLSMLCSLLFLSDNLDRPNLESVRESETKRQENQLNKYLSRIEKQNSTKLATLQKSLQSEYEHLDERFKDRIAVIQKELNLEMNNVVNGTFKGPRYAEIESRLNKEKALRDTELKKLLENNKAAYSLEAKRLTAALEEKQESAYLAATASHNAIQVNDFAEDERANDSRIVSFLKVVKSVSGTQVMPLQFVFAFSLLISLLMEIGILLAFNTITLSILPALKATHAADLSNDIMQSEFDQEVREDELRHKEAVNKIRRTADNVMDKANEYMRANPAQ